MDPIANMLTVIKNGYLAKKDNVTTPFSKFKWEILKVLSQEKAIAAVNKKEKLIEITLSYEAKKPKITEIKRVSKLGLRNYTKSKHLQTPKGGRGLLIVSTSKGVMSAKEAKNKNLGGEVICKVW